MRSFLQPLQRSALTSSASATCLVVSCRCIFVREAWTPVTLQSADASVAPFPARLLWQFRSSTPRHLTLCVRGPAPRLSALSPKDSFEDLDAAPLAEGGEKAKAALAPRRSEDYMYGRLFLRPYNVAQLLTVLQGWSDAPALVERPRSSLRLAAVSRGEKSTPCSVPREVQLTARLTHKVIPPGKGQSGNAGAIPTTDVDPAAHEDYPDSVYVEGAMGTLTAVLREEDLVLLTNHLESVLSDFFSLEHHTIQELTKRAVDRQTQHHHRPLMHQPGRRAATPKRSMESSVNRPHYLSQAYRSSSFTAVPASATPAFASAAAVAAHATVAKAKSDADSLSASPSRDVAKPPAASSAATAAAATSHEEAEGEEDEFEEIEEEVEEDEGVNEPSPAPAAAAPISQNTRHGTDQSSPSASMSPTAGIHVHAETPAHAAAAAAATTAASTYQATHIKDKGEMTLESENRYTTGRFVRDGSVAAAEVQEVSRIGDVDVMRRTQLVQDVIEGEDARTTVSATDTTGAFRSTAGDVTGTFAYQRTSTTTVSPSVATAAAAAAAAAAIPAQHAGTSSVASDEETKRGGLVASEKDMEPKMEVKATSVTDVEDGAGEGEEEEDEEEATAAAAAAAAGAGAAETPKRKRASKSSGSKKKKSASRKAKKPSKRKASSKAPKAGLKAETMAF